MFSSAALAAAETCPPIEELRPLLNSERIEACFGSYGVEVLCQDGGWRVSSLYSFGKAGTRVTRTLAVTHFREQVPADLDSVLKLIRDGASIGATLKANGWAVSKSGLYIGEVPMPDDFRQMINTDTEDPAEASTAAVFVYDLSAHRNGVDAQIATIAEMYDPRYLTLSSLEKINGPGPQMSKQSEGMPVNLLKPLTHPVSGCQK